MWSALRRRSQTATEATEGVGSPPPPLSGVRPEDWRVLFSARPNLLIVGDQAATSAMLRALLPTLQKPVWITAAESLSLPSASRGTLILQGATSLAAADQVRLLQWLSDHQPGVQLVTTIPKPLLPFVLRGAFLDTLYYRLNVVYLEPGIAAGARRGWKALKAALRRPSDPTMIGGGGSFRP